MYKLKDFKNGKFSIKVINKQDDWNIEEFLNNNGIKNDLIRNCKDGYVESISMLNGNNTKIINLNQIEEFNKTKETKLFKILITLLAGLKDENIDDKATDCIYKILKNSKERTNNKFLLEELINVFNILLNNIKIKEK